MSLEEHLLMAELSGRGARFWRVGVTHGRRRRYRAALEAYGVAPLVDALAVPLRTLSGGWQQIFVILCGALGPSLRPAGPRAPALTLLDEPTSSLDVANSKICLALIRRLNAEGHTIILTTHQPHLAGELGARLVLMRRGRVVSDYSAREVSQKPIAEIYGMLADAGSGSPTGSGGPARTARP